MLDPDGLNVWSDQRLVGYLWRNTQGLIGFRYEEEWLALTMEVAPDHGGGSRP